MRKLLMGLVSASLIASAASPAAAALTCDKQDGTKTSLGRTQDKYAFYANNIMNVGTSWRLEFRPRNSNCTVQPVYAQTPEGAANKSYTIQNDPMCSDSKRGYVSLDMPPLSKVPVYTDDGNDTNDSINVAGKVQGTLKGYTFAVAVARDRRDPSLLNIVALCTG